MKTKRRQFAIVLSFLGIVIVNAQDVVKDSIQTRDSSEIAQSQPYHWEVPVILPVDIDSIRRQMKDNEKYLQELSVLDDRLKANKKELARYKSEAKDYEKSIASERKRNAERRKLYKDDEKLLKAQKKLRDQDLKACRIEKKDLRKIAKELSPTEKNLRQQKIDEKERYISDLTSQWETRRQMLRKNISKLLNDEAVLDRKEIEVKKRQRELDRMEQSLSIKQKQLNNEQKRIKMQQKNAREMLK